MHNKGGLAVIIIIMSLFLFVSVALLVYFAAKTLADNMRGPWDNAPPGTITKRDGRVCLLLCAVHLHQRRELLFPRAV